MSKSNLETEHENQKELEFHRHQFPLPPSRSPLNTIPDPSQSQSQSDCIQTKLNGIGTASRHSQKGRAQSEANSAQTTPARYIHRLSTAAATVGASVNRLSIGRAGGSVSKVSRQISIVDSDEVEFQEFELVQEPSFWKDHNVQVLIRIRPLSSFEKVSKGYGRCLQQESPKSLVWLGHPQTRFTFDHVACETISQEKLFRVAGLPMVENCMSGYNSCMFAYGQTGSGKTYTMMGELNVDCGELNVDCGITPRIFEHLFMRIKEEEENRKSEGLKYSCKCSFLEIYNEQITDLLEPSYNNLQLREDLKKGVYVENLSDYDVRSANDVLNLLREGAANRKIAATRMNNESSRSHSVFTCIIESHWEKDSMNHFRFSRLNLVDLAGSERQKSSGAEGDRLKEAATINRSLSTLGLVIMSLVDLAQGKQRHVPYRDSRLTFLLQDSLGGNSKTTIIANVSPSVCSAGETFSTLKFAQRAKLIQNNAKVNEDASGDVSVLQQQIQQLKDTCKDSSNCSPTLEKTAWSNDSKRSDSIGEVNTCDDDITSSLCDEKVKSLKSLLLGTLRRENLAEMEIRRLKKELDQTNSLVHLHEEDAQHNKMILEIQDKRIKELELYANGLLSADEHLLGENKALKEEMRLLRAQMNENPYTRKVELEKMKLSQQLKSNQDFHEGGRETLLAEISELRDKLLELLEAEEHCWHTQNVPEKYKDNAAKELDECRDMNSRLRWEVDELQRALDKHIEVIQDDVVQTQSTKSCGHEDWKSSMEMMTSEQTLLLEQLDSLPRDNNRIARTMHQKEKLEPQSGMESENYDEQASLVEWKPLDCEDVGIKALQERLDQMSKIVEEALSLNNHASRMSLDHQTELVHDEIQMGTTRTINDLLEELIAFQSEFRERLHIIEEENVGLRKTLTDKDYKMIALSAEWERAILELTGFLVDGSKYLRDASRQIVGIASTFPHVNIWIREHIERAVKTCIQKEETILLLQHSLEEAQKTMLYMDGKLNSLKGATIAFTEAELLESDDVNQSDKVTKLDNGVSLEINGKRGDELYSEPAQCAVTTCTMGNIEELDDRHADVDSPRSVEVDNVTAVLRRGQLDTESMLNAVCSDMNTCLSVLQSEIDEAVSAYKEVLLDILNDISKTRMTYSVIRADVNGLTLYSSGAPVHNSHNSVKHGYQQKLISYIKDQLSKTNDRLNDIRAGVFKIANASHGCNDNVMAAHVSKGDCSFSGSDHSVEYYPSKEYFSGSPCSSTEDTTSLQLVDSNCQQLDGGESETNDDRELMCLRNKFRLISVAFSKLGALIDEIFTEKDGHWPTEVVMETEASSSNNDLPVMPVEGCSVIIPSHSASCVELKAGEQLETENTSIIQHIKQLRNSTDVSVGVNRLQQDKVHYSTTGIAKSIAWLEGAFEFMQNDLEESSQAAYHDASGIVHTEVNWIGSFRVMLEDIYTKALENELIVFFVECHVREVIHNCGSINTFDTRGQLTLPGAPPETGSSEESLISYGNRNMLYRTKGDSYLDETLATRTMEAEVLGHVYSDPVTKNVELNTELQRKEVLLKGLLFDFRLLQESAYFRKDFKDEYEKLINTLNQVQYELRIKTRELNDLLIENQSLKVSLNETDQAFSVAKSDLELARETSNVMSAQNADLRMLIKDLSLKNSETEKQLEEQVEVVKHLEEEILRMTSSSEEKLSLLLGNSEDDHKTVAEESEKLLEQLRSLQVKLDMAHAVADENEAVAVESRQESEASKLYAEQKEEEVRILEHSIEELECTINVMEKRVYEMEEEVQRQHMIRETLELEMQALRKRLSTVENLTENLDSESSSVELSKGQNIRSSKHYDFQSHIRLLEDEKLELTKEVKQSKAYIAELILHAEAQASQFQKKYKCLVDMLQEKKIEPLSVTYEVSASEKNEKSLSRTRGSSSPFRCITNLVQQVNLENGQELSAAKLRIEELEALAVNRQKEVCILKSRLAAAESMTHDVIRDLLGVKLDMTNLANLAEQHQLHKLVEDAQQQKVASSIQEEEIFNLRRQLIQLTEEREKCIIEIAERDADELATQIGIEHLKERDQLLTAQNDMLKVDKSNLQRRVAELDDMLKKLFDTKDIRSQNPLQMDSSKGGQVSDSNRKPGHLGKQLTRVNGELARCRKYERDSSHLK